MVLGGCQVCGRIRQTNTNFIFPKHQSKNGSTNPNDPLVPCDGQLKPAMRLSMMRYGSAMAAINKIPKYLLDLVQIVPAEHGMWQITAASDLEINCVHQPTCTTKQEHWFRSDKPYHDYDKFIAKGKED